MAMTEVQITRGERDRDTGYNRSHAKEMLGDFLSFLPIIKILDIFVVLIVGNERLTSLHARPDIRMG